MEDNITEKKLKWREPSDPTKFRLNYPPRQPIYQLPKGEKVGAWDNWLKAMMMDVRLGDSDRAILTAIAQHYNLDTGDCFPSQGRVAIEVGYGKAETGETGRKAVLRTVIKAVKLGWLKSISRRGGKKNQTNLYELTLPESIRDMLANVGPELTITALPAHGLSFRRQVALQSVARSKTALTPRDGSQSTGRWDKSPPSMGQKIGCRWDTMMSQRTEK
jgi:hypothetical protein